MDSSSSNNKQPKVFRRGETIFKAGDPVTQLYIVQSGLAMITMVRGGKPFEVAQVGLGQLLGEEALWGRKQWTTTAVANNDIRALPIDAGQAFALMGSTTPLLKIFIKGLIEKQRTWWTSLMEIRNEVDPTPCPPERIIQLFAVLHQTITYTGTKKNNEIVVVWSTFKKYCQRTFLESPVRIEQAINILVRLGVAELEMIPCETDPEAPDELGFVHFKNVELIRDFYLFYRSYYFAKVARGNSLPKTSEFNLSVLREIAEWNKNGKVALPVVDQEEGKAA